MLSQHVPNSGQRIKLQLHNASHDNVSNCARILVVAMSEGCKQAMSRLEELKCILCSGNLAEAGKTAGTEYATLLNSYFPPSYSHGLDKQKRARSVT